MCAGYARPPRRELRAKYLLGDDNDGLDRMRLVTDFNKRDIRSELLMAQNYDVIILDSMMISDRARSVDAEFARHVAELESAGRKVKNGGVF